MPARLRTPWRAALAGALLAAASAAALAGQVEVAFTQPEHFFDAGVTPVDRERNLSELSAFLKGLGQRFLASDETLKVEFTQVDLAGEPKPVHNGRELRIARGGADFPSLTLRYTLQRGSQVLAQGEETLKDMDYTNHLRDGFSDQPLGYEKRMLDLWFHRHFAPRVAHGH
jgi:hypothetical protein